MKNLDRPQIYVEPNEWVKWNQTLCANGKDPTATYQFHVEMVNSILHILRKFFSTFLTKPYATTSFHPNSKITLISNVYSLQCQCVSAIDTL